MSIELDIEGMESTTQTQLNRFKVTEGTHILRILPPFGKDHANRASQEINLHWGFETTEGKVRPVVCSYKTGGYCPICERSRELEALAARAKALGEEEQETQNNKDAMNLRNRRSFLYNAADKTGKVGILDVPKSLHDAIILLFKEYISKYDLDPTSLTDGVWLAVTREGKGMKTRYGAKFNKTTAKIDGDLVEKLDRTPLADSILNNYDKLAIDIHSLYKPTSAVDLKKILDGAPVDEIIKRVPKEAKVEANVDVAVPPKAELKVEPKVEVKTAKPVATVASPEQPKAAAKISVVDDWDALLNDE